MPDATSLGPIPADRVHATVWTSGVDHTDPAIIRDAMAEAIAVRGMPGYVARSPRYAEFLDLRAMQMAMELDRHNGGDTRSRDPLVIAQRALTTTSDFPALLAAAANKMLLTWYQPAQATYQQVFQRRDFKDFRPHRVTAAKPRASPATGNAI